MTTAASDDLICRVRAYLAGLEPPVPADELTDEEVAGVTLTALEWLEDEMLWLLLPERLRPPPGLPAMPPINVEVDRENLTARVSADTHHARSLEWGTYHNYEEARRDYFRRAIEETARTIRDNLTGRVLSGPTPPGPPPRPH
jgi:hypothetical protein